MKTPEQMAEEYADDKSKAYYIGEGGEKKWYISPRGQYSKEDFLAGYQAAKDQLADTSKVMNSSNHSNGSVCSYDMSLYLSDCYLEIARDGAERESRKRKNGEWTEWAAEANVLLALLNERKEQTNLPMSAKWISVKERLPRPWQEVLVLDGKIMSVKAMSDYGCWYPYYNGCRCYPSHWQPLPEPPKEEK